MQRSDGGLRVRLKLPTLLFPAIFQLADPVFGLTGFNHTLDFADRQESYRLRTARIKVEVRGLI